MGTAALSAVRRRNVSPVSSIITPDLTRDADCSGLTIKPEDGEFICVKGGVGSRTAGVFFATAGSEDDITVTDVDAASVHMVWGSAEHTDRRASGHTRVPYFRKDVTVETTLFYVPDDGALLNAGANFVPGRLLSLIASDEPVQSEEGRLLLYPLADSKVGWVVGHVESAPAASAVNGQVITVRIYDTPKFVGARK